MEVGDPHAASPLMSDPAFVDLEPALDVLEVAHGVRFEVLQLLVRFNTEKDIAVYGKRKRGIDR